MIGATLKVGKIRTTRPKFPGEAGYVQSVNAQLKDLSTLIQEVFNQVEGVTPEICLDAVQPTFQKSQDYCPEDTGTLKASGYTAITGRGAKARVEVGYAKGGKPDYAVYVHEITSYFHKPPTRAKWLQAAMMEDISGIRTRVADGYRRFLRG